MHSTDSIKDLVQPIAQKYNISAVYLFGSYGRGDAGPESDVDILIDTEGSDVISLFDLGGVYNDFERVFGPKFDLVTLDSFDSPRNQRRHGHFIENVNREKRLIYAK